MMKHFILLVTLFLLSVNASALSGHNISRQTADSLIQKIEKVHFSHGTLAKQLVEDFYELAHCHPDKRDIWVQAIYCETLVNYSHGKNDSSLVFRIDSIASFFDLKTFSNETALLQYTYTLLFMTQGSYAEAFQYALNALEKFEKLSNRPMIVKVLISLGNICPYIKNYNMADDYYHEAAKLVTPAQIEYYQIHINQCRILFLRGNNQASIDSLTAFMPQLEKFCDTAILTVAYLNLGACYSNNNQNDKAFECYTMASGLLKSIDNVKITIAAHQNMGVYYYRIHSYTKAYQQFSMARELAWNDQNLEQLSYVLHSLSGIFEKTKQFDSAFYYLQEYEKLNAYLMNNPKAVEVYQSYVSMLMEASQNKFKMAEQDLLLRNRQVAVIIISAIGCIIVIGFLLIISLQKRRYMKQKALLKDIENKELSERLLHEQEIQQLQTEKLESQVREITSYLLLLSNKNELLKQILSLTQSSSNNSLNTEEVISKIESVVKQNLHTDDDWRNFMLHFDKVHPRFFDQLKAYHLTKNDLKLSAYLRIGMSIKQIAQILNLTPDTVKVNRYRLKKKFSLSEEENLDDFIRNV